MSYDKVGSMNDYRFGSPDADDAVGPIDRMVGETLEWGDTKVQEMKDEVAPRQAGTVVVPHEERYRRYVEDRYAADSLSKFKAMWNEFKAQGDPIVQAAKWVDELSRYEKRHQKELAQEDDD